MQKKSILLFFTLLSLFANAQSAADTLQLSLPNAEKIFLQKNLPLIAARYNVDINKALIAQAKLWDNPVLNTDQNIYDGGFFSHNKDNGQIYIQVMQLIRTAGKRSKLAQLAADNTALAQEQFDDLMRTLRYTLQSDFFEINHLLKIKKVYDGEITELQKLVNGMNEEYKTGNISLKDNIRLKALLFGLQNELVNVQAQLLPLESEVKLLLQDTAANFIQPLLIYKFASLTTIVIPSTDSLLKLAAATRPDAKIAATQIAFQQHNVLYQKALAKPDISIGTEYDQRSSYASNYVGLAVTLPLNIFNKNQGNIKSAQYALKQQEVIKEMQYARIENEIHAAAEKLHYFQQVNNSQQLEFSQQYDAMFQNMLKSYQDRQLSLLEFIDFMDAYKDSKLKLLEQHTALIKAAAELNYTVNSSVIDIR